MNEPTTAGKPNWQTYYGDWAAGKPFGIVAWHAEDVAVENEGVTDTQYFQAIGDPFVKR